ncbi:MAG: MBL fold metallo-hydrolase [Firmicutes bacterium]|nr:MBL fold metallo-hydrolase [Bacillota bacterium]
MSTYFHLKRASKRFKLWTLLVGSLIVLCWVGMALAAAADGLLEVHFIDVGQGDSILVLTPDGKVMLVDAGDQRSGRVVANYLRAQGVRQIDVLVSTHPHSDHIGGMAEVLKTFPVAQVYDSGRVHTSKTFEEYLKIIDAKNIPFALARAGDTIRLGSQVSVHVLWPDGPRTILDYGDINESSIVLLLGYKNVAFLFTGDAGIQSEQKFLTKLPARQIQILKVGHHGSRSSTGAELLRATRPEVAVIMCGADNPYGHPHSQVLERLGAAQVRILRTDLAGSIVVTSDGQSYSIGGLAPVSTGGADGAAPAPIGRLININTASAEELQSLPGIGETLARRIIEYRIKVGLITDVHELLDVNGIGPATLEKIKPLITCF